MHDRRWSTVESVEGPAEAAEGGADVGRGQWLTTGLQQLGQIPSTNCKLKREEGIANLAIV